MASNFDETEANAIDMGEVYYGERLAHSLDAFLSKVRREKLSVDKKDKDLLNRCFAPGNPQPETKCEDVPRSRTFRYLESLCEGLHADPRGRSHVVDHYESNSIEDSIWLSLPKWQAALGLDDISWSVVTVRSIERSCFRETFQGWDVKHLHGTALVQPSSSQLASNSRALFSDQPRMVAHHGRLLGDEQEFVIRVFRCAPRPELREGIAAVLADECPPNVFDIWIRHHELPEGNKIPGFGYYRHNLGDEVTLLDLLTNVDSTGIPRGIDIPSNAVPVIKHQVTSTVSSSLEDDNRSFYSHYEDAYQHASGSFHYHGDADDTSVDDKTEARDVEDVFEDDRFAGGIRYGKKVASIKKDWDPVSPALATASSSFSTALYSPNDETWPHRVASQNLPEPLIVRVLSEDADFLTAYEDEISHGCKKGRRPRKPRNITSRRKQRNRIATKKTTKAPLTPPASDKVRSIFRNLNDNVREPPKPKTKAQMRRQRHMENEEYTMEY